MSNQNQCQEKWLDDIIEVSVFRSKSNQLGIPAAVPFLESIRITSMGDFITGFALTEKDNYELAESGSLTAKASSAEVPSGVLFTHEISASVEGKSEHLSNIESVINGDDCYVVLTCADGKSYLCYTLPGTFGLSNSRSIGNGMSNGIKISLKSLSEFVEIINI